MLKRIKLIPFEHNHERGAIGVLLALVVVGASLLGLKLLEDRTFNSLKAEAHDNLEAEKLKVRSALIGNTQCDGFSLPSPCTPGETISLPRRQGGELVAADGSTKFGKWNVQVECRNNPPAFSVMIARLKDDKPLPDPLTQKLHDWAEFMPLSDVCGTTNAIFHVEIGVPCYGFNEGNTQIPADLADKLDCAACKYANRFCGDNQRQFPGCPDGFQVFFRYIDRYGWGGMDLTKYTICKKIPG